MVKDLSSLSAIFCYFDVTFVGFPDKFRHVPLDANRPQDLPRFTSPTPHGVTGSQSGHYRLNGLSIEFHRVACPAGAEPATYGLAIRLDLLFQENRDRQASPKGAN